MFVQINSQFHIKFPEANDDHQVTTHLSKDLFVRCEGQIQLVSDVIILDPEQTPIELAVQRLQVGQVTELPQQGLVERPGEESIQEKVVNDGQPDDPTAESEPAGKERS